MKTFKLKALTIFNMKNNVLVKEEVRFQDGLMVNREDYANSWLTEVYLSKDNIHFFKQLENEGELLIQVKITKKSNEPATLISEVIGINLLNENINVLLMGSMLSGRYTDIQKEIDKAMQQNLSQKSFLNKFKTMI